ncbi:hypothetical protein HDV63DRAFT_106668 [Trichoderma sp. SZMC 28014]
MRFSLDNENHHTDSQDTHVFFSWRQLEKLNASVRVLQTNTDCRPPSNRPCGSMAERLTTNSTSGGCRFDPCLGQAHSFLPILRWGG